MFLIFLVDSVSDNEDSVFRRPNKTVHLFSDDSESGSCDENNDI
jgi:hypothetical protein